MFKIKSHQKDFAKDMERIMRKQLPYALSIALNETAKEIQHEEIVELKRKFKLTKPWWKPRSKFGINIKFAKKTRLQASVSTRAPWMKLHETGGIKKPKKSSTLAIPQLSNLHKFHKGKRSTFAKKPSPRVLLKPKKPFKRRKRSGGSRRELPFTATIKGTAGIYKRVSKGVADRDVALLYSFKRTARIKARFHFRKIATKVAKRRLSTNFSNAFSKAMRTAK